MNEVSFHTSCFNAPKLSATQVASPKMPITISSQESTKKGQKERHECATSTESSIQVLRQAGLDVLPPPPPPSARTKHKRQRVTTSAPAKIPLEPTTVMSQPIFPAALHSRAIQGSSYRPIESLFCRKKRIAYTFLNLTGGPH